eukprot:5943272-Amphidinium_carterae.1
MDLVASMASGASYSSCAASSAMARLDYNEKATTRSLSDVQITLQELVQQCEVQTSSEDSRRASLWMVLGAKSRSRSSSSSACC